MRITKFLRKMNYVKLSFLKWILFLLLGVFVLFVIRKPGFSQMISSKIYNDAVQNEPIHFHSEGKEENLLPLKKDVKPTRKKYKNMDEKALSEMDVYLTNRLIKIKKSCGDVCKTDQNLVINGRLMLTQNFIMLQMRDNH